MPVTKQDRYGHPVTLRSPRQASYIFGAQSQYAITQPGHLSSFPRLRSHFYVRFRVNDQALAAFGGRGIGALTTQFFGAVVKSIDRPAVQPETQELSQYNKKRQVYTGVKYQPVTVSLYDTADARTHYLWTVYSKWYFGDFNQSSDQSDWSYDVTMPDLRDNGAGFGFQPRRDYDPASQTHGEFFEDVQIYQFYNQTYTQTDLVRPRITAFQPDEQDYESSGLSVIRMTLAYEAIFYHNFGKPIPLTTRTATGIDVPKLFAVEFNGDTIDPEPVTPRPPADQGMLSDSDTRLLADPMRGFDQGTGIQNVSNTTSLGGGDGTISLGPFGTLNFGKILPSAGNFLLSRVASGNFKNLGGGLLGALGQGTLSRAVSSQNPLKQLTSDVLKTLPSPIGGISGQLFDQASGRVGIGTAKTSGIRSPSIPQAVGQGLAAAVISGGTKNSREMASRSPQGLTLSDAGMALVNQQRAPQYPIGTRTP